MPHGRESLAVVNLLQGDRVYFTENKVIMLKRFDVILYV